MKPVTLWFRENPVDGCSFNHIEDGHPAVTKPTPKCEAHKTLWKGGRWSKVHVWLTDTLPQRVVFYSPEDLS